jgi:hypothetical protein
MKANENALAFSRSLTYSTSPYMSDCESFGMSFGCRVDCPVFVAGNCEVAKHEDPAEMLGMVNAEFGEDDEDGQDLIDMYPSLIKLQNA